jgi:hypothetical protein
MPTVTSVAAAIGPDPGLVGLWRFNDNALDSSVNANHGTVYGASYVTSQMGKALSFDGSDYVIVPDSSSLEPNRITVEAWVKSTGTPGTYRYIVSKYLPNKPGSYSSYGLYTGSSGGLRFYVGLSSGWVASPDAGTGVWNGNWRHVAGTYDGSAVKLYVDGVQVMGAGSTTQDIYYHATGDLFIGGYTSTSYFFSGEIDEVRIWSSALSASQLGDITPPTITITTPANGAAYLLNDVVNASWSTSDGGGTGVASESGTVPNGSPIDTATVGSKSFTVNTSDYALNSASATATYNVTYGFIGLLPPYVAPPKAFKMGSSIPLKWQYTDSAGNVVDSSAANPQVIINPVTLGDGVPVEGAPITVEDPGASGVRYDSLTMTWQSNWQTKGLSAGIYNIRVTRGQTEQTNGPFPIQLR